MDQQNQEMRQQLEQQGASSTELQKQLDASHAREQEILQVNLDQLDPDTRARVLQDSRLQELFGQLEQKLTARFSPAIESLNVEASRQKMGALAQKYPAFDVVIHAPLIEIYRGKNPHSSVEQAFKAIAQDGELVTRDSVPLQVAPSIVVPNGVGGPNGQPRYMPTPQADPVDAMRGDAARAAQLMRTGSHADRQEAMRLIDKNLSDRLGSSIPGR